MSQDLENNSNGSNVSNGSNGNNEHIKLNNVSGFIEASVPFGSNDKRKITNLKSKKDKKEKNLPEHVFKYHTNDIDVIVKLLNTNLKSGLTSDEIENRLNKFGYNLLSEKKKETFLQKLWRQLN